MKKRALLFTAVIGIGYLSLTSSTSGAGIGSGYNCTGSETGLGNAAGCASSGSGCHSTTVTAGITTLVELDSAGVTTSTSGATGHYKPGFTYTVKITGTNTTSATLPKFGFQASCIKGSTAVTTPVNAGTWGTVTTPLRNTTAIASSFVCNMVEHRTPINATTLGGATGGTYVVSFTWTAPAAGTGTVSIWSILNAVNGNNNADAADKWNTATMVLNELPTSTASVATVTNNSFNVYPNPVVNTLNVQSNNNGAFSVKVFDLNGRLIITEQQNVTTINTTDWAQGLYQVVVSQNENVQVIPVVKQ